MLEVLKLRGGLLPNVTHVSHATQGTCGRFHAMHADVSNAHKVNGILRKVRISCAGYSHSFLIGGCVARVA